MSAFQISIFVTLTSVVGMFVGSTQAYNDVSGLPENKTKTPCTNECPIEADTWPLQVELTPGWKCSSSASGDCVECTNPNWIPGNGTPCTEQKNTALLMKSCELVGLSESLFESNAISKATSRTCTMS
jgi:hypothetical protein